MPAHLVASLVDSITLFDQAGSMHRTSGPLILFALALSSTSALAQTKEDQLRATLAEQTGASCPKGYLPVSAGMPGHALPQMAFDMAFVGAVAPEGAAAGSKTATTKRGIFTCMPTDNPMVQQQIAMSSPNVINPNAASGASGLPSFGGAAGASSMSSMSKVLLDATAAGAAVEGAKVAAPLAGQAIKHLGGLLGHGPQSKESILKDLAKGSVTLKSVRFIGGSDALEDGADAGIAALADALKASEGLYLLYLPAELQSSGAPDTTMLKRRLGKIAAQLLAAGISDDRLAIVKELPGQDQGKKKSPAAGEARLEILKAPADWKP